LTVIILSPHVSMHSITASRDPPEANGLEQQAREGSPNQAPQEKGCADARSAKRVLSSLCRFQGQLWRQSSAPLRLNSHVSGSALVSFVRTTESPK